MAVRIRLRRTGKRNAPCHRIVVADARSPRNGRFIENIGIYDPRQQVENIDLERVDYWVSCGAIPSETVEGIIKRARAGIPMGHDKEAQKAAAEEKQAEEIALAEAEPAAEETEDAAAAAAETQAEDQEAAAENKE